LVHFNLPISYRPSLSKDNFLIGLTPSSKYQISKREKYTRQDF
jgi:hypothetical protein